MKRWPTLPEMPWKNGGGRTRPVAVHPPGASLDDFQWRISIATIEADGPFSRFEGIDRCLVLLSGTSLLLRGDVERVLPQPGALVHFRGEEAIEGRLGAGPTVDLNVMVRRGVFRYQVEVVQHGRHSGILVGLDADTRVDGEPVARLEVVEGIEVEVTCGRAVSVSIHEV